MPDLVNSAIGESLSLGAVLLNLLICAGLTVLISWHFNRFGGQFTNKSKLTRVLPAVALTTLLIIGVVKSSLALSLGLVGALSIVRFRTPIKEPEELAYLFLAIATGLCLGADQRMLALVAVPTILGILSVRHFFGAAKSRGSIYLNVEMPHDGSGDAELNDVIQVIEPHARNVDLRRVDVHDNRMNASFFLNPRGLDGMLEMQREIRRRHPKSDITIVEQGSVPTP